ncbi:dTDP-4-dehydrorhamnose reductase [Janthinobacterium sp. B9-8]|uniref:dTDP-4-dehydrorhamnose reductase n=1 Tax=Janthinobacterium sp. B9-8 TaxID=1236179 RepID=UPI00061CE5EF|nr:dTDP-4-dehydrorhamnose reductase [Janthinobacterium sp. B9-8]AMC37183.1 dTDP-4-dehydrorhamnose reductase [Janthinobacterium sp. B9-8]
MQTNSSAMPLRILVTGKNGQLGFELQRSLAVLGSVIAVDRENCDLSDPDAIRALVARIQPHVIVNPAAHTAVDKAESEPELAHAINTIAPQVFAEEAAKIGALLVHYSTDYVFDGTKDGWYSETDTPNPQSVYGKTKLAGELAIAAANPRHLIFRTSWVFGAHGGNFLKTILRLAGERDELKIIADQHGAPTAASLLADMTAHAIRQVLQIESVTDSQLTDLYGTYHLVAAGSTTWHGYAESVVELAKAAGVPIKAAQILAIPASSYPLPAPRPANSQLSTQKLQAAFGLCLPDWHDGVAQVMTLLSKK